MVWRPTRRDAQGDPPAAMNQRTASAPWVSISAMGSRVLPRCLLIFRPSSARMSPRQTTLRYAFDVEHHGVDRHQRVEPATGLVDALADEVGREGLLEPLRGPGCVREPPLRKGHRARVEPGVDHLGHPAIGAVLAVEPEGHVVDEGPVRIQLGQVAPGQRGQLGQRLDADHPGRVGVVAPDRQRGAPVAAAGQRPVDVVVQPVAVPPVLDRLRVPGRGLVLT